MLVKKADLPQHLETECKCRPETCGFCKKQISLNKMKVWGLVFFIVLTNMPSLKYIVILSMQTCTRFGLTVSVQGFFVHIFKQAFLQYRSKVSWQSLASRSSRRETRFSILETFDDPVSRLEDRVSSFDDRGSSFKFRFEKALSLKVYTYLSFQKWRLPALGRTRSLSRKRSSRFESENVRFWSPVNIV